MPETHNEEIVFLLGAEISFRPRECRRKSLDATKPETLEKFQ